MTSNASDQKLVSLPRPEPITTGDERVDRAINQAVDLALSRIQPEMRSAFRESIKDVLEAHKMPIREVREQKSDRLATNLAYELFCYVKQWEGSDNIKESLFKAIVVRHLSNYGLVP